MTTTYCPNVQKSNAQRVFAMIEDTAGTLVKPAATGLILPAGRASISQTPTFTDTPELMLTNDIITQARDAMPPGDWSVSMVARLAASHGVPQGEALLKAAMGALSTANSKRTYSLQLCRPSLSLWLENEGTAQFMSGCVVERLEWKIERSGFVVLEFSGRGRKSGICGVGKLASAPNNKVLTLEEGHAARFSVGGYVHNRTTDSADGIKITAIDLTNNTLTLESAPSSWSSGDLVGPWFPTATAIGKEVESNSATISIDGVQGRVRPSTFTATLPAQFLEEIGDTYPGESVDNRRSVSMSISSYFRWADAASFQEALDGATKAVAVSASNSNGSITFSMPKVRFSYPAIGEDEAVLTLDCEGTALGESGEDSFSIVIE